MYTSNRTEGHPDKVCDQISDAILDACLANDPAARVACETAVGPNLVVNLGEITCKNWDRINPGKIAREVVQDIGYDNPTEGFSYDTFNYLCALHGQSGDIARGVTKAKAEDQGAGDQGMMFGYASNARGSSCRHRLSTRIRCCSFHGATEGEIKLPASRLKVSG